MTYYVDQRLSLNYNYLNNGVYNIGNLQKNISKR